LFDHAFYRISGGKGCVIRVRRLVAMLGPLPNRGNDALSAVFQRRSIRCAAPERDAMPTLASLRDATCAAQSARRNLQNLLYLSYGEYTKKIDHHH
jgi:hypothetical protein